MFMLILCGLICLTGLYITYKAEKKKPSGSAIEYLLNTTADAFTSGFGQLMFIFGFLLYIAYFIGTKS